MGAVEGGVEGTVELDCLLHKRAGERRQGRGTSLLEHTCLDLLLVLRYFCCVLHACISERFDLFCIGFGLFSRRWIRGTRICSDGLEGVSR